MSLNKRVTKLEEKVSHLEHPNTPRQQDETSIGPQTHSANKDEPTIGKVSLKSNVPPSPSNSQQSKNPWYKTLNGWKVLLEVIAIPFAVGYAIVTYCQWQDFRREQRAWVKAELAVPSTASPNYQVDATIVNVGKIPALRPIADISVEVVDADQSPSFRFVPYHNRIITGILFPSDRSPAIVGPTPNNIDGSRRRLTDTEIAALGSGGSYIAVFGVIRYEDDFGKHWTRFCSWQAYPSTPTANQNFSANGCARYNQAGENDPPM